MWLHLAFAAGTGGSCLVIGSAAGVAAMGMERIDFFWYLRRIGGLALLGYLAGSAVMLVPHYW
jgi:Na+/H+ antiporter NhaD/arsenite permease-like protein